MGRVKLEMKRIENTTKRQVTFSKRRSGLVKKAYELSVLCDVDVALIMFSPAGRLTLFSPHKRSIEDILARYVDLPDHERGRSLHNQEVLQRAVNKLRSESTSPVRVSNPGSHLEAIKQEVLFFKSYVEGMEIQLRIFEGNHSEVTDSKGVEFREKILEETLKNVFMRKEELKKHSSSYTTQIEVPPENIGNGEEVAAASPRDIIDWLPLPPRGPQIQVLSLLDTDGLLCPLTDEVQRGTETIEAALRLGRQSDDDNIINPAIGFANDNNNEETTLQLTPQLAPLLDVTLSPWSRLYSTPI